MKKYSLIEKWTNMNIFLSQFYILTTIFQNQTMEEKDDEQNRKFICINFT